MKHAILPAIAAALLLWGCDKTDSVSGTNDETSTSLGRVLRPDGRSAAGARVLLYASGDTQTVPAGSGIVDADGRVVLVSVPKAGYYSLLAKDDSGRALFEDSLVSNGKLLTVFTDTVRSTGRVVGRVSVQPQDKPTIAWVQLLGAGRYVNVDDSGKFAIDSVPAGRFTVAALTLTTNYTPTFRAVKTIPDTTVDVGAIALVYTGIPQVQGVKVTWDSVANTATVNWNGVSDTAVSGYTVYRTTAADPSTFAQVAYVTAGTNWTDTLFGAQGSLGKALDSVKYTVRYRVVASTYLGNGPVSRADSVVVRSPLLVATWNLAWTKGALPGGADPSTLDSLGNGLAVLGASDSGSQKVLWTSTDGSSWTRSLSIDLMSSTFFYTVQARSHTDWAPAKLWKKHLVWCTARSSGRTLPFVKYGGVSSDYFTLIDSVVVHRFDGATQDSTTLATQGDSVSLVAIVPAGDTLALFEQQIGVSAVYTYNYRNSVDWKSGEGSKWTTDADNSAAWWFMDQPGTDGSDPARFVSATSPSLIVSTYGNLGYNSDSATVWHPSGRNWLESGTPSWGIPRPAQITGLDSTLVSANASSGALRWAPTSNPASQHRVAAPASGMKSIQIWRGKLWVSDGTSLWSAPVPVTL